MTIRKVFRIIPAGATDWKVISDSHVFSSHKDKDEAVDAAVHLARKAGKGLVFVQHSAVYAPQK